MAFSYSTDLTVDLNLVRFRVQDTVESSGPLPNDNNFDDTEITNLLTIEGSVGRTVAALFETLAAAWASEYDTTIGPRKESASQAAKRYDALAKRWRDDYGYPTEASTITITSGYTTRQDGYSNDITAGEA